MQIQATRRTERAAAEHEDEVVGVAGRPTLRN
jgi:hypothetical protein